MARRQFAGGPLIVATHNKGKLKEIIELLAPYGAEVSSAGELGLPEPEETGLTFIANALGAKIFLHERLDRRRWLAATGHARCGTVD